MCIVLVIQLQNDNCLVKNITTSFLLRFLKKTPKNLQYLKLENISSGIGNQWINIKFITSTENSLFFGHYKTKYVSKESHKPGCHIAAFIWPSIPCSMIDSAVVINL